MNKLDRIKAEQLKQAEETGVNPYQDLTPAPDSPIGHKLVGELANYQSAMEIDLIKIKAETTLEGKARIKQTVLPTYLDFVNAYVANGDNYPNDVAVQVMIMLLDIGDIEGGLDLGLHLVKQGQKMPQKFDRDMQTFLCDFIYDWASVQLKAEHSASPYLDVLTATTENDNWNMHPVCMSKLFAMLAKHKELAGSYQEAFDLCVKAETINPEKAGVKGLKERLQAKLQ